VYVVAAVVAVLAVAGGVVVATSGGGRHPLGARTAAAHPPVTAPTTTPPPPPTGTGADGVTARWVQAENAEPGTTAWRIGTRTGPVVSGFADHTSATAGQTVGLYVSTPAPSFTVTAYRMGWYGGDGARRIWSSPVTSATAQPPCPVTPGIDMVSCPWSRSLSVTLDPSWPQGDYLFKLSATGGQSSYVPLTVTDPTSHSAYVLLNSVLTWEAWNAYGGYSCFQGPSGAQGPATSDRARVVSYDRPYASGDGASDFLGLELPAVEFAERAGLDVTYLSDVDVTDQPQLLSGHRALISLGHNEFWSAGERDGIVTARASGLNLAFLGATAGLRPARLQPSPLGPDREVVAYRSATEDPVTETQPVASTPNEWGDPPLDRPSSDVIGETYGGYDVDAPMVVTDPSAWVFAGTGATAGTQLPGVIGGDYDHVVAGGPAPSGVRIFTASPLTTGYGHRDTSNMTYYTASSGAGVLDTGSIAWVGFLDCPVGVACTTVQAVTGNVFRVFGNGPAGRDPATAAG
jgi:hypothetical protein